MNLQKYILACFILIVSFQICFGQYEPTIGIYTSQFDEFGKIGCEDLWARLDNIANHLEEDEDINGYIFIYGNKKNLFENLHYESWINGYIKQRKIGKNRLNVIRSETDDDLIIKTWLFHTKLDFRDFIKEKESAWSYALPASTKPFIFHEYLWEDGLCPISSQVKLYADFLFANPEARGHLVIRNKNMGKIRREEPKVLDELVNQYKVPRNRLKVFYQKDKNYEYDFTDVEFWYVPKMK